MSKYTPGPWTHERSYVVDMDYGRTPLIVPVNGENPVCQMTNDYVDETLEANARLIAAAPDLLEALEDAVRRIKWQLILLKCDNEFIANETAKARVAIAKARGEA